MSPDVAFKQSDLQHSDRRCEAPQGGAIIGATTDELSRAYFFGAAAAATGSAVKVPAASNGFTLIVPSSLFAVCLAE
jgi:hypothetical protein